MKKAELILFRTLIAAAVILWSVALFAQPDSAEIQNIVQTVGNTGTQFLPQDFKFISPFLTFLLTTITAAIIRAVEKKKLKQQHKAELAAATKK